jgi:plasmid stability protein
MMIMTTQIRNLPDDVHKELRRMALDLNVSLNALVVRILSDAVAKAKAKAGKA